MDFSIVAHDLRTPLNAMLGHTQLLAVEKLSAAGRRRLEIIETQIQRMTTLLDTCTSASSRSTHVTFVDLNVTLRSVVAELDVLLQQRGVEVEMVGEAVPLVIGDRDALHRVFVNVIVNAAESMSNGGRILVHAHLEQASMASLPSVAIDFADSGSGIPPALMSHVFERGVTTKNSGHESGLGLAICQEIVEAHGGRIGLSSAPGEGTIVYLSLPIGGGGLRGENWQLFKRESESL